MGTSSHGQSCLRDFLQVPPELHFSAGFRRPASRERDLERRRREFDMSGRLTEQARPIRSARYGSHDETEAGRGGSFSTVSSAQRVVSSGQLSATSSPLCSESGRSSLTLPLPSVNLGNVAKKFGSFGARIEDVSSILNPPDKDDSQQGRRVEASQRESPTSFVQPLPPILAGCQLTSVLAQSSSTSHTAARESVPGAPRRILTPRSPSLRQTASLGQMSPLTETINVGTNSLSTPPCGEPYTVVTGVTGAPQLPATSAHRYTPYDFGASTRAVKTARRACGGASPAAPQSSSASPATSYSAYGQSDQAAIAMQYDRTAPVASHTSDRELVSAPPTVVGLADQKQMAIPISPWGWQDACHNLTLETTSGTVSKFSSYKLSIRKIRFTIWSS